MKLFSEASEQNKKPILNVLSQVFRNNTHVLEIGSGSGQHAVYFSKHLLHLDWQPSDLEENLGSIRAWIQEEDPGNILEPIKLDVRSHPWSASGFDAVFTANTFHIMSWAEIEHFFQGVGAQLEKGGGLLVYGPFAFSGKHISQSNEHFDQYLRQRDPLSGVRDFEDIDKLAIAQNLVFMKQFPMPVNNSCLYWQKRSTP